MNKTKSKIVSAAVAGLFLGGTVAVSSTLTSCGSTPATKNAAEKHACKGLNSCANKGGCSSGDNKCSGKNSCAKKGGCATVDHHSCAKQNACAMQGGCASSDKGCAGKNSCAKKGGCAVPVKGAMKK